MAADPALEATLPPVRRFLDMASVGCRRDWQSVALLLGWDDLRFFLAITRTRNLSAGAGKSRVTQSIVGRRLASLENGLGARLLHGTQAGYAPTLVG